MGAIPGSVRVTGFMAPSDTLDTYAVTDEMYNRGGYRSVPSVDSLITQYHILVLNAGGYTPCVPGDIGLQVTDDGAPVGTLTDYDNATFTWWITGGGPWEVAAGSVIAITGGTGAGTAGATSIPDPFYITDDRLKQGMLVKALDTGAFWTLTSATPPPLPAPPPVRAWAIQLFPGSAGGDSFRWVGNYLFRVDTSVDGAWTCPMAGNIAAVYVDVENSGSADGGTVTNIWDVKLNGISIFAGFPGNRPLIACTGAQASAISGAIITPGVVAWDRITVDTVQVGDGSVRPATFALTMLVVYI